MIADARYAVLGVLGEGGMATVYLVENVRTGRREALKVLNPAVAESPRVIGRFRREARVISRLHHQHIVGLHDFGRLGDGSLFLTTEFAEGESLGKRLARLGPLPIDGVLGLLVQLLSALEHAHSRGVIHRDLKPDNLLLVDEGGEQVLKVIDFGVAKISASDYADSVAETGSREIFGTPYYMAPEQIGGQAHDPRIDIYAVGIIAYELLVGRTPFAGPLPLLLHHHLDTPAPHPSASRAEIPAELDAAILRCLEKHPDNRFQSAAELALALERVPGFPVELRRPEVWQTELAAPPDDADPIDVMAASDALIHAAAEALLATTQEPELERVLAKISTQEIALDAIETEMAALEQDADQTADDAQRARITDQSIDLAARKSEQEDAIAAELASLRGLVDTLGSGTDDRLIRELIGRERGLRLLRGI